MIPPLRIIPPPPWSLASDPGMPFTAVFPANDGLSLATAACGLGIERDGSTARVRGTRDDLARLAAALEARSLPGASELRRFLDARPAWRLRSRTLDLSSPVIMGILNLTTDSFSGDGVGLEMDAALRRAEALRNAGADIIDVGAETARANRPALDPDDEAARVGPVIAALAGEGHTVSVDTYKATVARAALDAGAEIVNDISGLTAGEGALHEALRAGAAYVLNYSYSPPKRRPDPPPAYQDVVVETIAWFYGRLAALGRAGLPHDQVAIDPGIAFGKSHDEDLQVLRRLGEFASLGHPVLLAHSRKNVIGSVTGSGPAERDLETHIVTALAYARGARIFRVHDVAGTLRALRIAAAMTTAMPGDFAPGVDTWPWAAGATASHATAGESTVEAPRGQRW
ncbi:MAG: hypothetical protein Kow0010_09260 [Dehalococcoidia bacterium]